VKLVVRAGDDPRKLAQEFGVREGLDADYISKLEGHIRANMEKLSSPAPNNNNNNDNNKTPQHVDRKNHRRNPPSSIKYVTSPTSNTTSTPVRNHNTSVNLSTTSTFSSFPTPIADNTTNSGTSTSGANKKKSVKVEDEQELLWKKMRAAYDNPNSRGRTAVSIGGAKQITEHPKTTKVPPSKNKKKKSRITKAQARQTKHLHGLHQNAFQIEERKRLKGEMYEEAEREYMKRNRFRTGEKTKEMAARRESVFLMGVDGSNIGDRVTLDNSVTNATTVTIEAPLDVGDRLYIQAHLNDKARLQATRQQELKRSEDEMLGCTFRPQISDGSRKIERYSTHADIFESLYADDQIHKERAIAYAKLSEPECTFKPDINPLSRDIVEKKENVEKELSAIEGERDRVRDLSMDVATRVKGNKWDQLYFDYSIKQELKKLNEMKLPSTDEPACSFMPDIGLDKHRKIPDASHEDFIKRLYDEHKKQMLKREEKRKQVEAELFKPAVGRSPLGGRNEENLPIHDHLDREGQRRQADKDEMQKREEEKLRQQAAFKALPESDQIIATFKRRAMEELFRTLLVTVAFGKSVVEGGGKEDKEEKFNESLASLGIVSEASGVCDESKATIGQDTTTSKVENDDNDENDENNDSELWKQQKLEIDSCDASLLSAPVAKIVEPVLGRHKGGSFTLEDFCSLLSIEVNHIGPSAINILRNNVPVRDQSSKEKAEQIVHKFHPKINRKSRQIIENKRQFSAKKGKKVGSESQVAMLFKSHEITLEKQEAMRKMQRNLEEAEWTFQPQIFSKKSSQQYLRGKKAM